MSRIIGLTGPVGAGKNEAAKVLQRQGALVIHADELAHTLYKPQSPLWRELVKAFGSRILIRGGKINRKKLGAIVFSSPKELKRLDRIVHPYLKKAILKAIESRAQKAEHRAQVIIINAAVLKEIGLIDQVDEVWVVIALRSKRLKRLLKSGLGRKQAEARLRSQVSQKEYLKMADVVIRNEGSLRELSSRVADLL